MTEASVGAPDADGNLIGGPVGGVIDPRLGPLTNNGGRTFTHALLPDSPAIDMGDPLAVAGSDDVPQFDQRDAAYSRIVGGRIDMGAFERGVAGDTNGDGKVDFADFVNLANHFGTGQGWAEGNFDGSEDGTQFADFVALAANFGYEEPRSNEIAEARRAPAATSSVAHGLDVDQGWRRRRSRTELVDVLLASGMEDWLWEPDGYP